MAEKDRSDMEDAGLDSDSARSAGAADQESAEAAASRDARREARRRVLLGGLTTAPLIMTLASRPALATGQFCGASFLGSANTSSNHEPQGCSGKTPGYWKTHASRCWNYFFVGPCNPITSKGWGTDNDYSVPRISDLQTYIDRLREEQKKHPWRHWDKIRVAEEYLAWLQTYPNLDAPPFGTPFAQVFGAGCTEDPETTMMQALWLDDTPPLPPDGLGGPSPVLAHSAAAYCNAHFFGKSTYGLSPAEVVELVASMIRTDPLGLKDILETMNERG